MTKTLPLTKSQKRALNIVKHKQPITPWLFSKLMWPDSSGHDRYYKCGESGSTKGLGMALCGGGYLGKLTKRGWVKRQKRFPYRASFYAITTLGTSRLNEPQKKR